MTPELKKWLYTPCENSDLMELEKNVYYMPIGVVKKKIEYMEENFSVSVSEFNFHHFLFNQQNKETIASGSIGIKIIQLSGAAKEPAWTLVELVGTATFPLSYYGQNTHYAATLESLCIVNAFGGKYPQFGSALNKMDVAVPVKLLPTTVAAVDEAEAKLFSLFKKKLLLCKTKEHAESLLSTSNYNNNLELKNIVNNFLPKNN